VLLHRREAHRVVAGQLGHALVRVDRAAHDVASGGVTQCPKMRSWSRTVCMDTTIRMYVACQTGSVLARNVNQLPRVRTGEDKSGGRGTLIHKSSRSNGF
jgi:hypothetical protein